MTGTNRDIAATLRKAADELDAMGKMPAVSYSVDINIHEGHWVTAVTDAECGSGKTWRTWKILPGGCELNVFCAKLPVEVTAAVEAAQAKQWEDEAMDDINRTCIEG